MLPILDWQTKSLSISTLTWINITWNAPYSVVVLLPCSICLPGSVKKIFYNQRSKICRKSWDLLQKYQATQVVTAEYLYLCMNYISDMATFVNLGFWQVAACYFAFGCCLLFWGLVWLFSFFFESSMWTQAIFI